IDRNTIDFLLDEPIAFFLSLLSMHECAIVSYDETAHADRRRLRPSGAGPFRIDEVVEGERVRLVRNHTYWVANQPLLDELNFRLDLRSARDGGGAVPRSGRDV